MRIRHCLLCTLGTTQALTMSSYLTPLTNSQTAPLMFEPIHGDEVYCPSDPFQQTLIDDKAIDCREHAMVLFINRRTRCILLEVPNAVGWKLHFGLALSKNEDVDARVAEAVAASGVKVESCVRTGVMLFTFRDCSEAPMRVFVYEASVDGGQTVGLFHAPEEVPYERMWADDKVWLPHVLEEGPYFFSGHFVFSGPPPGKLVAHNCRGERGGGLSFWE
jgi:hypothetical protein